MSGKVTAQARLSTMSKDRAQLFELLLERGGRSSAQITAVPRPQGKASIRLPSAWAQQRLWFVDQLREGDATYNNGLAVELLGTLDLQALRAACDALVMRHETLRTVLVNEQGEVWQEIAADGRFELSLIDLSDVAEAQREDRMRAAAQQEAQAPFDLRTGPLIRGRLIAMGPRQHLLLVTAHHIVSDGWSLSVLLRELAALYRDKKDGRDSSLPPLPVQYADYAQWQRQRLQGASFERQLSYWRDHLGGAAPWLELPTDKPRPAVQRHLGEDVPLLFDRQLVADLNAMARRRGMTLFMLLYAAWAMLMAKLSGQQDVVIGTPVANRRRPELEGLIGFFVNTLALRVQVSGDASLADFLTQVEQVTLGAFDHQDLPFERVVEALSPERSLGRHLIFQVAFALQNAPQSEFQLPQLTATLQHWSNRTAKFDLLLLLETHGDRLAGCINYDTDLFERQTVMHWAECLTELLHAMVADDRRSIDRLALLSERQRRRVVVEFNDTRTDYPSETPTHELFEKQVARAPDAIAVVLEERSLTYRQLNDRANRLAWQLGQRGLRVGDFVPLLMRASVAMLIAQLAVLKCGAAYVPIDPDLPDERRKFMIRDCGGRLGLTDGPDVPAAADARPQWICYEATQSDDDATVAAIVGPRLASSAPAYVMYTSGSTGTPKGVIVPHYAINRLVIANGYAPIGPADCLVHHSNPAFDASTFEIWGALLNGARLVIVSKQALFDTARFAETLRKENVTLLWLSVGVFNQYARELAATFARLRYLIVGGDRLEPNVIRRLLVDGGPRHLLNGYGPTECTTFSTTHEIASVPPGTLNIPIGRGIANAQIYILDRYLQPLPIGVAGEMYIGGAGVACGYLNRPQLTAERFLADPFVAEAGSRLYKTGDLARWRADGTVEFLGRNDFQVKIRGFRIELGEIEAQLLLHPQVSEAAVVVREAEPGEKRIVAYVSAEPSVSGDELRQHLKALLPEYMMPNAIVFVASLPLTVNGKLDRRALPAPEEEAYATGEYQPPEGPIEGRVAEILRGILQVPRVGRYDNFFELGGHSMLAIKALFQINQAFGVTLKAVDMYGHPTVSALARRIAAGSSAEEMVVLEREALLDESIVPAPGSVPSAPHAILLTGSTGFVGRFLLAQLLRDTQATVHCLVRASSERQARSRLLATLRDWGLWRDEFAGRLVAVPGDLAAPRLGLDAAMHSWLCRNIDAIYHCATSMNHLETYAMAKPTNVAAVVELLRMSSSVRPKQFNYLSTLSVFSEPSEGARRVDETTGIDLERHPVGAGYAASKWVGEKLVMTATERGLPCNIFRLGLVWADAEQGRYDELQREFRIFKSCLMAGVGIADYRYASAPTPVDFVARAVVFLAGRHPQGAGVFHISSTQSQIAAMFERCNEIAATGLQLKTFHQWVGELRRLHEAGQSLPAVPLIEYAFDLDEQACNERQRPCRIDFDCERTHRELAAGGIVVPALNDAMLQRFVQALLRNLKPETPLVEPEACLP